VRGCGRQETLRLVFRAREGVVVAESPLRHSKGGWEGWCGVVVGRKPLRHMKREWEGWSRGVNPSSLEKRARGVVVGRKPLRLVFRAREGVVVAEFPLRHSKWEWEGWSTWLAAAIVVVVIGMSIISLKYTH